MPHVNKRPTENKPWQSYYDSETRDIVLEMYGRDFALYGYSTAIDIRPELGEPALNSTYIGPARVEAFVNLKEPKDAEGNRLSQAQVTVDVPIGAAQDVTEDMRAIGLA